MKLTDRQKEVLTVFVEEVKNTGGSRQNLAPVVAVLAKAALNSSSTKRSKKRTTKKAKAVTKKTTSKEATEVGE